VAFALLRGRSTNRATTRLYPAFLVAFLLRDLFPRRIAALGVGLGANAAQ
jgi:hypothetical protein